MNDRYIRVLTVYYDTEISNKEIPFFRGAVLKSLGDKADLLFHNHVGEDKFRYAYPCIQYKRLGGKAAIVCVEEGVDLVGKLLSELSGPINIGNREAECRVDHIESSKDVIQVEEEYSTYQLYHWLPLNSKNYRDYLNTEGLVEKLTMLERILANNILSFLKSIEVRLESHMAVHITDILSQRVVDYKGVKMMSFDIRFKANISLPSYIGIGKSASMGHGTLKKITT